MDKKNIKRIIAREGLVLFCFVIGIPSFIVLGGGLSLILNWDALGMAIYYIGFFILPFTYPVYLFIRFIIWAIRTLVRKQLIVAWAVGISVVGVVIGLYLILFPSKKQEINPNLLPVIHQIENRCLKYVEDKVDPQEYERCKEVNAYCNGEWKGKFYTVEEYYKVLERSGFNLPPLYKPMNKKPFSAWTLRTSSEK